MISIIGVVFVIVFLLVVANIVRSGFQTTRMVNKVFSLAEREIDRKLQATGTSNAEPPAAQPQLVQCGHCGSKVSAGAQCPNCGAKLA